MRKNDNTDKPKLITKSETAELLGIGVDLSKLSETRGLFISDKILFYKDALCVGNESALTGSVFYNCSVSSDFKNNEVLNLYCRWISGGAALFNLSYSDLTSADLTGADLTDANLTSAGMRHSILSNANLTNAKLEGADLINAILKDANLKNANLSGANLTGANLTNANLTKAYLRDANLTGAILKSAKIKYTNVYGTILDPRTKLLDETFDTHSIPENVAPSNAPKIEWDL